MTTTLSPPVRIFAVLGVLAAVGFAAFTFLMGGGEVSLTTPEPLVPVTKPTNPNRAPTLTPTTPARTPTPSATRETGSGFPLPIDRALRRERVVVVVVSIRRGSVDALVRTQARAAARDTRAGFVSVNALDERLMRPLVAKTGLLAAPAVLVVRRPGVVTARLGVTDQVTVAQAVAQARRR